MTDEPTAALGFPLPAPSFAVRIFTLCDHAEAVAANSKLYINGAGVSAIWTANVPGPLTPLYLALRLAVPWQHTTEPFNIKIRALNADRSPVGRDPLFELDPEIGRPPGLRPWDESAINGAFGIGGLPIQEYGTIYFHLEVAGETLAVHPLKITPMPAGHPR
ncbi:MAG: hypothetical protein IT306_18175 [Chloroflexi bacterium]|nr:hypothetical protein [Chloroflexota bacterium]